MESKHNTYMLQQLMLDQYTRIKQAGKGNKYIMVLYDYDSNAILAKPIKDRTSPE
jgi:hypothetical protein